MKKINFFLIFLFLTIETIKGQPQDIPEPDWNLNKSYLVLEGGATTYTNSPVIGAVFVKEITDDKYPLVVQFRYGILKTTINEPKSFIFSQVGFAIKVSPKVDVGVFPIYFLKYIPKTDFRTPIAVFTNIHKTNKLAFRIEAAWFWGENKPGISATLNYKLLHLKEI